MSNANFKILDAGLIAAGLQKPKRAGPGKYVACCPAHDEKSPSFSIEDAPDGKILVYCHAGCSQDAVIDALRFLGLWHQPSPQRIAYLERQSLAQEIQRNRNLLALAQSEYEQGFVHTELDRARINRAIRFLERHGNG